MLVAVGCLPDISGDPPPSDKLIFPVGLATTANNEHLIVANSNFKLQYNAGTLVTIDLSELDEIIENGGEKEWISPDEKVLHIPEEKLIEEKNTLRIDAYASDLELTSNGKRALVPIRGGDERHILIVDVNDDGKSGKVLSCGEGDDLRCNGAHKVTSNDNFTLPIEPYEVATLDYSETYWDDEGNESTITSTLGFATHLYSGSVSAFIIENNEGKLDAELIGVVNNVVPGASGIAVNPTNNEIYVSGRENSEKYVAVLQVFTRGEGGTHTNDPKFGKTHNNISYANDLYGGTDARGIAVNPTKNEALVVTRNPNTLLRIDTNTREIIDMTSLGADPSIVRVYEDEGKAYAFVVCYESRNMYVVDPETMQVYVRATGSGPHAIAFDSKRDLAYVANFSESTISVLQAVPPFDHVRVEGKDTKIMIGRPDTSDI